MNCSTVSLVILILILIALVLILGFLYWRTVRGNLIRNNLFYSVQQGVSNSQSDIFVCDDYDVYVCNAAPMNVIISSTKGQKGRMVYVANQNDQPIFIRGSEGITLLQSRSKIQPKSYSILVFIDRDRLMRLF